MTVRLRSATSSPMISTIPGANSGSDPAVARRGAASRVSAPARRRRPSFCFMPPESWPASRRVKGRAPSSLISRLYRRGALARLTPWRSGVEIEVS